MNEVPFYKNRKFMAPILTTLATLVVAMLSQSVPLPFTERQLADLLPAVWFFVVGIVAGGDVAYDLLGQILRTVLEIIESRQNPSFHG